MSGPQRQTDVVVAGSGMAGLVSTVRVLEHGADVTILEKGSRLGGKTYLSDGAIVVDCDGDPQLPFEEPLDQALDWLRNLGIDLEELERQWGENRDIQGLEIDAPAYVERMGEIIESEGGEIYLEHALDKIVTDEDGAVSLVKVRDNEGNTFEIKTDSVILCTGGFGGNERLVEQYITEHASNVVLRADPWSTGDGLLAAQEIGAKTTPGLSKFDGHSMVAPPASYPPQEYIDATQYYGPRSIAIDWNGERFTDESQSELEVTLIQAVAKKADGRAVYIIDDELYNMTWVGGHIGSMIERAREYGGNVIEAQSLAELKTELAAWGVNGTTAIETIESFNEAIAEKEESTLEPPRERFHNQIDEPPFYAVEIKPGLTFTMGGLDIDENCQVIRRAGSSSTMYTHPSDPEHETGQIPIGGLYAVGIDAGNPSPSYYIGALSRSLIGGRIAGEHAANYSK